MLPSLHMLYIIIVTSKFFHQGIMKAAAVILFFAVCGTASANLMQRQPSPQCDITDPRAYAEYVSRCAGLTTAAEICNTKYCSDYICNYYKNKGLSNCVIEGAQFCRNAGASVPFRCAAPALVTIKGLLVAVLLFAALIVI